MSGKASLYVIIGFSVLFLIRMQNYGSITNRSVDNYIEYHNETVAHNIALSAANIVANQVYRMPMQGASNSGWQDYQGGKMRWSVSGWVNNRRTLTATGIYGNGASADTSIVQILVTPNSFARYAYFSEHERANPTAGYIWWMGKDVVDGPFHTQDNLRVATHPKFLGESTSHFGSLIYQTNKKTDSPIITGLYQPGLSLPIPDNSISELLNPAIENGKRFSYYSNSTIRYSSFSLTFNSNGTITYSISGSKKSGSSWVPWNPTDSTWTAAGSTLAPNGVIYFGGTNGSGTSVDMRLKGTVQGQYTVSSEGSIWLDDDIVYNTNPKIDPTSTDLLGICSKDYVWITKNDQNRNDINIQAAIFCQEGGFGAQDYNDSDPSLPKYGNRGNINLLGGISQSWRQPVGTFSGETIKTGYAKKYTYDRRLASNSPPCFPGTGLFRLVSWYEK